MRSIIRSFRDLLFPPLCLHCRKLVWEKEAHLCSNCTSKLELISPSDRCPRCFSEDYIPNHSSCPACRKLGSPLQKVAAACHYGGPAASIVRNMKYQNHPYLSKGAGALMVAQFCQLEWPLPDVIVPVPLSLTHWLERGYNQSKLLAEIIAKYLDRPLEEPLKRYSGDYSQAGLSYRQRINLSSKTFALKKHYNLYDKRILLIDDVMTTGSTCRRCAEVLYEGCPTEIYALTFCCTA